MRSVTTTTFALSLVLSLFGLGCSAAESDDGGGDSEDELRALSAAEIVGSIAPGETKTVAYSKKPTYRALRIDAAAGATLDLWVKSTSGDAHAWLLGSKFQTITSNSDASATDDNSHIVQTVKSAGTYYIAFRDEKYKDASFDVSLAGGSTPPPPPPPPPVQSGCSTDADCGGGPSGSAAMCFIDRCVTVSEETRIENSLNGGVLPAYTSNGDLQIAYQVHVSTTGQQYGTNSEFTYLAPWSGTRPAPIGSTSHILYLIDHAPGQEPVLAASYANYNGDGISYGSWGGPSLKYHERIAGMAVARNSAGTRFAALVGTLDASGSTACNVYFSSAPASGSWSTPQPITSCSWGGLHALAIHVRKDGGADLLTAGEFGNVMLYRRPNPIDPWAATALTTQIDSQQRALFTFSRGGDGTTHLVTQPYVFTSDLSNGDYTGTYVELGDNGVVRSVPLGTYGQQWRNPFGPPEVDAKGNVWIQKRIRSANDRPTAIRIDRAGVVKERALGLAATGPWVSSALAVAPSGELAFVHLADGKTINLRRFTPVK